MFSTAGGSFFSPGRFRLDTSLECIRFAKITAIFTAILK